MLQTWLTPAYLKELARRHAVAGSFQPSAAQEMLKRFYKMLMDESYTPRPGVTSKPTGSLHSLPSPNFSETKIHQILLHTLSLLNSFIHLLLHLLHPWLHLLLPLLYFLTCRLVLILALCVTLLQRFSSSRS